MSAVISVKLWDDLTDLLSTLTAWDELIIRWEVSRVEKKHQNTISLPGNHIVNKP